MAATVSAWSKPGAWALDSEEHEAKELLEQQKQGDKEKLIGDLANHHHHQQPLADFPSLSVAVSTKSKKKKGQTLTLSEFSTGKSVSYGSAKAAAAQITTHAKGLTTDELLILPTGPRERTSEELERSSSRLGGGFRSYGSNGGSREDSSNPRWGSSRVSDEPRRSGGFNREINKESGPSRADEIDDWGAAKKSSSASAFERRERGGFFDSQSKADESDSWVTNKACVPSDGRRSGNGFENHRERRGGGFDMFQKESLNGGMDSETWGKKREDGNGSGRPKLVLQPRTLPISNGEQQQTPSPTPTPVSGITARSKGSNPFGEARPREEILAEKGQDWKKIDEKLESMKTKEGPVQSDGSSFGKKSFGSGNGRGSPTDVRIERSWRKTETVDVPPQSTEKVEEDGGVLKDEDKDTEM